MADELPQELTTAVHAEPLPQVVHAAYACDRCPRSFRRFTKLVLHLERTHAVVPTPEQLTKAGQLHRGEPRAKRLVTDFGPVAYDVRKAVVEDREAGASVFTLMDRYNLSRTTVEELLARRGLLYKNGGGSP